MISLPFQLDVHLSNQIVDELNPAMAWSWNFDALNAFSAAANSATAGHPVRPEWISTEKITAYSFATDVIAHCAAAAGVPDGVNNIQGRVMISPNDTGQSLRVQNRIGELVTDAFMQHFMADVPTGQVLAKLFFLVDKVVANAQPTNLPPPPAPFRPVFE